MFAMGPLVNGSLHHHHHHHHSVFFFQCHFAVAVVVVVLPVLRDAPILLIVGPIDRIPHRPTISRVVHPEPKKKKKKKREEDDESMVEESYQSN